MNSPVVSETELHAYLDGELSPERMAEVAAHLHDDPQAAARLAHYETQRQALHAAFDPLLDEALPSALTRLTAAPAANEALWQRWRLPQLAAGIALLLLGASAGWLGHARWQPEPTLAGLPELSRRAAVAHVVYSPDPRRPVEIAADQEELLVRWLSKRLGSAVRVPHLGNQGFSLVGGRLLPGGSGPVAQFMYQAANGERLTLYLSGEFSGKPETGFRFAREGEINVFYWIDGRFGYALSGSIDKAQLARVATAVYDQLGMP